MHWGYFERLSSFGRTSNFFGMSLLIGGRSNNFVFISQAGALIFWIRFSEKGWLLNLVSYHSSTASVDPSKLCDFSKMRQFL